MTTQSGFGHEKGFEGDTNVWLTPPALLKAIGPFDLDPCAAIGQPWKTAELMLTEVQDGLRRDWDPAMSVFCNPPYGPNTGTWLTKCAQHGKAIALVFARTETGAFFSSVWGKADGILFLKGRVRFHRPDGSVGDSAGAPSVLIAYGEAMVERLARSGIEGYLVRLNGNGRMIGAQGMLFA